MPVLLLVFPALTRLAIPDRRVLALAGGGSVLGFILMNISFNGWHGGACVGPRYQIPVLSLYILILTGIAGQRYYRPLLVLLLIPSFLNMLAIAMISPMAPESVMNPMEKYYTGIIMMFGGGPDFIHPFDFPIRLQSRAEPVVADWSTFNWGEVIGLEGVSTVIPWLVLMVVGSGICCSWSMSAEKR